jgi:hypothetical protein
MSGQKSPMTGLVYGTAANLDVETVGYRPKKVVVRNENRIMLEWQADMADASAFKTVAAGTRTLITTLGITPLSNGFRIGTDSINGSGEVLYWEAFE